VGTELFPVHIPRQVPYIDTLCLTGRIQLLRLLPCRSHGSTGLAILPKEDLTAWEGKREGGREGGQEGEMEKSDGVIRRRKEGREGGREGGVRTIKVRVVKGGDGLTSLGGSLKFNQPTALGATRRIQKDVSADD